LQQPPGQPSSRAGQERATPRSNILLIFKKILSSRTVTAEYQTDKIAI
jgi:hypothetical protein